MPFPFCKLGLTPQFSGGAKSHVRIPCVCGRLRNWAAEFSHHDSVSRCSSRTAQGSACCNNFLCIVRTPGAAGMNGLLACQAKKPATHAAIPGSFGSICSGLGPSSEA